MIQVLINLNFKNGDKIPVVIEQEYSNDVHLKMHKAIYNDKGELSTHHIIAASKPIENMPGYLISYFGRTMGGDPVKQNTDIESFTLNQVVYELSEHVSEYNEVVEQGYLNGNPVVSGSVINVSITSSGSTTSFSSKVEDVAVSGNKILNGFTYETVLVPKAMYKGLPRYSKSDLINNIFYHSGVSSLKKNETDFLRKLINNNMSLLSVVAEIMSELKVTQISKTTLMNIVNSCGMKQKEITSKHKLYIQRQIERETTEKHPLNKGLTYDTGKMITLDKSFFY